MFIYPTAASMRRTWRTRPSRTRARKTFSRLRLNWLIRIKIKVKYPERKLRDKKGTKTLMKYS
jgi:hypothetical protein